MVELSVLASAAFTNPGVVSHQEFLQQQLGFGGLCRPPSKDFQTSLPGCKTRQEILRSGFPQFKSSELVDPWRYKNLVSQYDQLSRPVSTSNKPVFIDVQDDYPNAALCRLGVAEQCIRHEKILQFLMSGSSILEGESLNVSLLSDPTGLHTLAIDICQRPHVPVVNDFCLDEVGNDEFRPSLIYPQMEFFIPKPFWDCIEDLSCTSMISTHPDGRVLFMGTEAEIRDLLSIVSEFYLSKNSRSSNKREMVVPYFRRSGNGARANTRSMNVHVQTVAPVKRPETIKLKPSQNKKVCRKAGKERDIYGRNYFHACEKLLSVVLDKNRSKVAILSLKKSSPEISQLLTQFSAGIAGTGLAVLFSVVCKITSGKVPFCTTKLLNTGFALGLVWLSAAVNALRDNILSVSRNSSKTKPREDEIERKVEESVNQIFFRMVALMAMTFLRFA
uniref:Drebrin-like protein n=1 Tax=Anthurium amnicola TaxID=1678845 RepID=A0A1D1Y592_9ARAE